MEFLYQYCLKPILFLFSPDFIHDVFVQIGIACGKFPPLRLIISLMYGAPKNKEAIVVDNVSYYGPVLLSAGFDYNAYLSPILWYMGFAGEEIGSVTARRCEGNPPPRLTRLLKSKSIQVYKGLKNDGVEAIIERIKKQKVHSKFVRGISIAKTNDQKNCSQEEGIKDYCYSFKRLNEENIGDFYTINISCPNSFGGEDFAKEEALRKLLGELKQIPCSKPIYVKMPIHPEWEEFHSLLKVIDEFGFQGVVIGNLNKNYDDLDFPDEVEPTYRGGLSGRPCFVKSNNLVAKTREAYPHMTIFGCGGIFNAEDAQAKFDSGSDLIQLISGMIFSGPQILGQINEKYAKTKS